jgi:glutamyl-tRNA synthetase
MPNTLTVSPKQSPFPYAAIAIAAYTGIADLIFDDSAAGPVLAVDGTPLTLEEDIVQALAKEGGLSSDSEKVIYKFDGVIYTHLNL